MKIDCLDIGFVQLVEYMGDDNAIVQAARVSYGKGIKSKEEDARLIRYLMRHRHTSPFEMVTFKFHCKMPIFVARQWVRHRTASLNELSGRYSRMPDEKWMPDPEEVRAQSNWNKQVGDGKVKDSQEAVDLMEDVVRHSEEVYGQLLEAGVCREQARTILPLGQYTEWYWQMNLHNLLHFLKLRLAPNAQKEIRVYAEAIAHIIKQHVPVTWAAFEDYTLNSKTFFHQEVQYLQNILETVNWEFKRDLLKQMEIDMSKSELCEFKTKLGWD